MSTTVLRALVLGVGFTVLSGAGQAAPPTVNYLFPAGAQRGTTLEIMAGGTFERWPVRAWAEAKGVEIKAAKDKGKFTVTVAADAQLRVAWVRMVDEQGASALRPFVIGTLPEVREEERKDPAKPQVLPSAAVVVNGRLEKPGEVDGFAVTLQKGQTLVASMLANRTLGSPMDAHLQILSPTGFVLAENNDYHGLDPQIVFQVPADGQYVVRTFAFPAVPDASIRFAGAETFIYRLTLTTAGFVDHAWPLAVPRSAPGSVEMVGWNVPEAARKLPVAVEAGQNLVTLAHGQLANTASVRIEPHAVTLEREPNDRKHPQGITLPVTVSGRIDEPDDVDVFEFTAKKGQPLLFQVESASLGFPLDPVLRLTDTSGKVMARAADVPPGRDPELPFTPSQDGNYRVEVRDLHSHGGSRYVYRLRALMPEPDFELTVATDRMVVTPGKPLDVPVTLVRRNGFNGEVVVSVEDLPEGVTAEPTTAAKTASTAPLRLTAKAGGVAAPIRIVGRAAGKPDGTRTARFALTSLDATTSSLWLTTIKP
jgi:hypothetical protein